MKDFANPGREELFDLLNDPNEMTNLADSNNERHAQIRKALLAKIQRKMKANDDPALRFADTKR